AWLVTCP
uniref:Virotoxin n=1 Tax=Amanita virosa TaxID=78357 RepID=VIRTX_AMAVR|nr:RecName: Full=Virotoxin; AltName: Full=Viroidin; AltName: Full=Viroisin [Amanita virosa]